MTAGGSSNRDLRVATFEVDATPPIGSVLCDGLVKPASSIDDRIGARGLVLLGEQEPIVLCVVDWTGIGNGGNLAWREALALAAGTSTENVAVHTTHAHDTPGCDFDTESLLAAYGLSGAAFDPGFARETIASASAALHRSLRGARKVTHVGFGQAAVKRVASNRRLLGRDGKVRWSRWSATGDQPIWKIRRRLRAARLRALPEGTIDPNVYVVSFWDETQPVTALSYYACHPQSHYGQGAVSADFPGLARGQRQAALGVPCLHFNGAGGNVTAGKYNDGRPKTRDVLARRLVDGLTRAWQSTARTPIAAADVCWQTRQVALNPAPSLDEPKLLATLASEDSKLPQRVAAARQLAWLRRCHAGSRVAVGSLRLGPVRILHLPGELFVEYQLAARELRPDSAVVVAAYGDYGMGYIATRSAYAEGGYEVKPGVSLVSEDAGDHLFDAVRDLLAADT